MHDFLGDLLDRIEQTGANFSSRAYGIIGDEIVPLLTIMFIAYVAYYGLQLVMGTARVSVSEIIGRVARMLIILALVKKWDYFNTLFYAWLNNTPEDVGRAILTATGTGITEPTNGLSMIWKTANDAASAFAEQSGYLTILPSMVGFLIMLAVAVFIAVALAILLLAKVMMWVLIGTAPIFIGCMLFDQTRSMGVAWFQQVLTYALIPLFVYVVAAFLIAAMDPELTKVTSAASQRRLQLSDISAFLLLCAAGAFVLFNIQVLAQGITGGVAIAIGNAARAVGRFAGVSAPISALSGGQRLSGAIGNAGMQARARTQEGMRTNIRNASAEAMQNRISSNSLPR
ncbi:type IV secretion system protein [Rhizobium leguminosarum]|uniref:type IV secretion system protein n=1 Tax=Rhizobium leguminosarum TaxID=384 RepID=UPI00143F3F74|nr:type IV secretion system protein [Rhizobium leguminosarum]NKL21098.1 conjugal transfer protein TrbL [Rhizobium leguminosarum bv. viciae]NKL56805.1 conjugal transfer protein TrbL [Rhizobium leguminosarum bv. viciae]